MATPERDETVGKRQGLREEQASSRTNRTPRMNASMPRRTDRRGHGSMISRDQGDQRRAHDQNRRPADQQTSRLAD
ncbi:uncharacterized protein SPSK_00963 [Sporothrix schenckii 1099-18]|uniref:Uncharacterized protein n=1 Tax=Sporothrix schenckii 1099-18 TaxID=1397361 RepID=A0A0F2LWJ6_SPOSC|nr:uncharacterized protein SPSK_00963 [Sporothrix schenckii 1099-18]KJR81828.1 hypothetical protein SPSK_00963 [Sporothrix schenckii 1099-18]